MNDWRSILVSPVEWIESDPIWILPINQRTNLNDFNKPNFMIARFFDLFAKNVRSIIAILIVLGSFSFLFALLRVKVPEGNATVLNVSAGLVLAALAQVCNYFFGSSKDKSDTDKSDSMIEKAKAGIDVTKV